MATPLTHSFLSQLVKQGLSTRAIAERAGCSQTNIRYHLNKHGLATQSKQTAVPSGRRSETLRRSDLACAKHGTVEHILYPSSRSWRCRRCAVAWVGQGKRDKKALLVEEAGGKCLRCGGEFSPCQFDFHHRPDEDKEFTLSSAGISRGIGQLRAEAAKCDLLCANCHRETEEELAPALSERAAKHYRRQEQLIADRGCMICGYKRSQRALDFHHLDPGEKRFGLGHDNMDRRWADLEEEAAKCVILCANCHRSVEAGLLGIS